MKFKAKQKVRVTTGFHEGLIGAVVAGEENIPPFWKFWAKPTRGYVVIPKTNKKDLEKAKDGEEIPIEFGPVYVLEKDLEPWYETENTDNIRSIT